MEEQLIQALNACRERFGWNVCIKDFYNLMLRTAGTSELLRCFINHESDYCSRIKRNSVAFSHCVEEGNIRLRDRLRSPDRPAGGFWGTCWCGVREFVAPIWWHDEPIGAVIIGSFRCGKDRRRTTMERLESDFGFVRAGLEASFDADLGDLPEDDFLIRHEAMLAASYIQLLCEHCLNPADAELAFRRDSLGASQLGRLNHAILYIKNNLGSKLTISQIAKACWCSESSISHLFKERMEEGVNAFILQERIAQAQRLIAGTDATLSEIAARSGFGTNKYMTGVFKRQLGITPSEYRLRNQKQERMLRNDERTER